MDHPAEKFLFRFAPGVTIFLFLFLASAEAQFSIVTPDPDTADREEGQWTAVARGGGGIYLAYWDPDPVDDWSNLVLLKCADEDCEEIEYRRILDDGDGAHVGYAVDMTVDNDGYPRICYRDATNGDLKYVRCATSDCLTRNVTAVDSIGDVGYGCSIAMSDDNKSVISYYDPGVSGGVVKVVRCSNLSCSSHSTNIVATSTLYAGDLDGARTAMRTDSFSRPMIVYFAGYFDDLKYVHCSDKYCAGSGTGNVTNTIDTTSSVGKYVSIAKDSSGNPMFAYFDQTNDDLKYAKCFNQDCSGTKVITTVDGVDANVGRWTAIIGIGGDGRIAYYDETNGNLKFASCTEFSCSFPTIVTLDAGVNVGQYASVALTGTDLPRISYCDGTNGDLKYARCDNSSCSLLSLVTTTSSCSSGPDNDGDGLNDSCDDDDDTCPSPTTCNDGFFPGDGIHDTIDPISTVDTDWFTNMSSDPVTGTPPTPDGTAAMIGFNTRGFLYSQTNLATQAQTYDQPVDTGDLLVAETGSATGTPAYARYYTCDSDPFNTDFVGEAIEMDVSADSVTTFDCPGSAEAKVHAGSAKMTKKLVRSRAVARLDRGEGARIDFLSGGVRVTAHCTNQTPVDLDVVGKAPEKPAYTTTLQSCGDVEITEDRDGALKFRVKKGTFSLKDSSGKTVHSFRRGGFWKTPRP